MIPKIESDVPMPAARSKFDDLPWASLAVGESFEVTPYARGEGARGAALRFAKMHPGWIYKSRRTDNGVRFWRVA